MRFRSDLSQIHGLGMFTNDWVYEGEVYPLWTQSFDGSTNLGDMARYVFEPDFEGRIHLPLAPYIHMNHSDNPIADVSCDENNRFWLTILQDSPPNCEVFIDYGYDPAAEVAPA